MPTWKKVIVSGSQAHLAAVTASTAILVGTNQQITTAQSTTFLTGSFTGSFTGNGAGLTGVTATFPSTAITNLATTDQFFVNDGANKAITYANLVLDLAGSGAGTSNLTTTDTGDSLALTSQISVTGVTASFVGNLTGTASWATNATTATTASVTSVTDTTTGTGPYYITFKDAATGHPLDRVDSTGLTYNATTNVITGTASYATTAETITPAITNNTDNRVLTATGAGTINGEANLTFDGTTLDVRGSGGITTNQTTFPLVNTTATTVNFAGAATTLSIGAGSGTTTVNNSMVVTGDLTVNGTTTIINTDNLLVEDRFILLASGSTSNTDSGIVVQNAAGATGSAFYYDGGDTRWAVAPTVASNATAVAANSYIVTVSGSSADPSGNPLYGAADSSRIGAMYVNTTTQDIWIWS